MPTRSETNAKALELRRRFEQAGATLVEPPLLQPAETLLDLYGEDIRGRAYVTSDALRGEQMLRPDFTVPVVQMHMAEGAEPARYTYAGEVFRRQEDHPDRPNEYVQVGYEVFDRTNPAVADAGVFALMEQALSPYDVTPMTGDIGLLKAAVVGLDTSDARRAALMRHIWRPKKFRALLDRFAGKTPMSDARAVLLAATDPFAEVSAFGGKRSTSEIEQRIAALKADTETPPFDDDALRGIDQLLAISAVLPEALKQLHDLSRDMPSITVAIAGLKARMDALQSHGVQVDSLMFETSYGRTSMEYYDGFVFGFYAQQHADMPAIATGGRYDALTQRLGDGQTIPAVGGVLRPGLMLELETRP